MIVPVAYLIDRLRHPRSRADQLQRLRLRMRQAILDAAACSPREREVARAMRQLRAEISRDLGRVDQCTRCAVRYPPPHGRWDGGYCCGTHTENVFTDDELASLAIAGTRMRTLQAPRSDHAGCVFRGPTGCSIDPADRPSICARYVCLDLARELRSRGDMKQMDRKCVRLTTLFAEFVRLRRERASLEQQEEMERALGAR